jgi:hypothetical protein
MANPVNHENGDFPPGCGCIPIRCLWSQVVCRYFDWEEEVEVLQQNAVRIASEEMTELLNSIIRAKAQNYYSTQLTTP